MRSTSSKLVFRLRVGGGDGDAGVLADKLVASMAAQQFGNTLITGFAYGWLYRPLSRPELPG